MTTSETRAERGVTWWFTVGAFITAMISGVWLRYGYWHGFPGDLLFVNVRHAHSHLMFFSWVAPALMLFGQEMLRRRNRPVYGRFMPMLTLVLGALSFVPFMLDGYGRTDVFGRELPLSMMISGFNVFAWLIFGIFWGIGAGKMRRDAALRSFELALLLLLLSAAAALGLAFVAMSGNSTTELIRATVDLFIGLFSEGWMVLGLFAVALETQVSSFPERLQRFWGITALVLTCGLVVRYLGEIFVASGYPELSILIRIGGIGMGISLGILSVIALREVGHSWFIVPLLLLLLKALADVALAFPAGELLYDRLLLRVLFLHAYLLGAVSFGLLLAARNFWGKTYLPEPLWPLIGNLLLLASLILITGLRPAFIPIAWVPTLTILGATLPIVGLALAWFPKNRTPD